MPKARVLSVRVFVHSLEQIASDLDVVLTALKALPSVNFDLGPLKGATGRPRIGQILVGRACEKVLTGRPPRRGPA